MGTLLSGDRGVCARVSNVPRTEEPLPPLTVTTVLGTVPGTQAGHAREPIAHCLPSARTAVGWAIQIRAVLIPYSSHDVKQWEHIASQAWRPETTVKALAGPRSLRHL